MLLLLPLPLPLLLLRLRQLLLLPPRGSILPSRFFLHLPLCVGCVFCFCARLLQERMAMARFPGKTKTAPPPSRIPSLCLSVSLSLPVVRQRCECSSRCVHVLSAPFPCLTRGREEFLGAMKTLNAVDDDPGNQDDVRSPPPPCSPLSLASPSLRLLSRGIAA